MKATPYLTKLAACFAVAGTIGVVTVGDASADAEPQAVPAVDVPNPVVEYYVVDQGVPSFFALLAQETGARLLVSDGVGGRLRDLYLQGDLREIIERVARTQDLDWFVFGDVVHISARSEVKTRVIRLGDLPIVAVRDALTDAGLQIERFGLRRTAQGTAIALSGPPRFLAVAETIIETIPASAPPELTPVKMVRMRRGNVMTLEPVAGGAVENGQPTDETTELNARQPSADVDEAPEL